MRCAIYARYSSDLQRDSSIEDQVRKCRDFAGQQGWGIEEEYVRYDQAVSSAAFEGRDALRSLVESAKRKPRPFERILIEDTSRLARNLSDSLRLIDELRYHGVDVNAVTQGIDSAQKTARPLLALHGLIDEQFLEGLREKVHRGQEGRVLKGLHPGGRCYGYRNVPIEDPTRQGKYGRPAVSGVRLEIVEAEATIVRRIFQMYAAGTGLASIAKAFNEEGLLAPQPPRTRSIRAWCPSSIQAILRNGRYHGVFTWNRTVKQRNPHTGRKISRNRPPAEWLTVEVPDWRIVPEDLWNDVQQRIVFVNQHLGACRAGGLSRTVQARKYLFSGILVCGVCGSRLVIISGSERRGYVRYGCPSHRYRGVCGNRLTIRQERLEEQLLQALEEKVLSRQMLDYTVSRFLEELQRRMGELRRQQTRSALSALHRKREELRACAERIADAIAVAGYSPTLLARLSAIESESAGLERQIEAHKPIDVAATAEELRSFVMQRILHLRGLLRDDLTQARTVLMKHIPQLVLTPMETASGPVFEVSGNLHVASREEYVMPVVARDGIGPPTPVDST